MAIKSYPSPVRASAADSASLADLSSPLEQGCCQPDDRHHSLVLTQLDGTTEGFPLTWLYHWQWRKEPSHEVLTLTLTEHKVTIHGSCLDRIMEHLRNNHGLHLQIKDDRYFSIQGKSSIRISAITIKPHTPPPPNEPN